jgi:hypothetical protein
VSFLKLILGGGVVDVVAVWFVAGVGCGFIVGLDVNGRGYLDLNVRRRSLILSSWILARAVA